MTEGIEPRKDQEVGKADAVIDAEGYILVIVMVRLSKLPRGLRPWHATTVMIRQLGRPYRFFLKESMATQMIIKQGSQMTDRESDYSIVPMK